MRIKSFRLKATLSLVFTVLLISVTFFSVYSTVMERRIYQSTIKNSEKFLLIVREQMLFTIGENGGKIIYPIFDQLRANEDILNIVLFDAKGGIVYPDQPRRENMAPVNAEDTLFAPDRIGFVKIERPDYSALRSVIRVENSSACQKCHESDGNTLGFVMMDFSVKDLNNNLAFTKNFTIVYSLILVFSLLIIISLLHYRFVKRSMSRFLGTIQRVEKGEINVRVEIPETDELGKLAKSFNRMLDRLQRTQTELTRYHQRELLEAQRLASIGEMAASLANEIKNPITGIANAIEVVAQEIYDEEKQAVLREIHYQVDRVNRTLNDLLLYSRPVRLVPRESNLNQLVESVITALKSQSQNKQIRISSSLQENIPACRFDPDQLKKALINLGQNAIQAIDGYGEILFETGYDPDRKTIFIKVNDTGKGIDEAYINRIFKPFFTTRHRGTGLGLTITADIIHRHNGEILVENKPYTGCVFTIVLPVNCYEGIEYAKIESPHH